jgi:hypothetical protein
MVLTIKETCSCGAVMEYSYEYTEGMMMWATDAVRQRQEDFQKAHASCRTILHAPHEDKRLPVFEDSKWTPFDNTTGSPIVNVPGSTSSIRLGDPDSTENIKKRKKQQEEFDIHKTIIGGPNSFMKVEPKYSITSETPLGEGIRCVDLSGQDLSNEKT